MKFILQLRKPYLNVHFSSDQRTYTRVIERPAKWMAPDQLSKLTLDLRRVVQSLNIGNLDYGILAGSQSALENCVVTVIYDKKSELPIAFNAMTLMDCTLRGKRNTVVHLGLVCIDPSYRAQGISWILYGFSTFLLFLKNRFKPIWISNVTQVPAIIGMVSESFVNVYPNPKQNNRRSYDHLSLGREIMSQHRQVFGVGPEAEFDEEYFVIRNAYTGGSDNLKKTFEQAPKHRNELFNSFCHNQLDYNRGDDFLQLGQIDVTAYYNYMIHMLPKGSRLVLLYRILFSIFKISFVPLVQWYSVRKQMGHLRPRKGPL